MAKQGLVLAAITFAATTAAALAGENSAATLFGRGDLSDAATAYEAVLQTHPSDVDAKLALGTIRLYENDRFAAEPLLDAVLDADPKNVRATHLLAELQRRNEEAARRTTLAGSESVVPFVTADPLPIVRVVANGTPANFLVDTGGDVDIEPSFAAKLGVKSATAGTGTFAGGRQVAVRTGMLTSLALGEATAYDVPVHIFPTHLAQLFPKLPVGGVIGTTYFERFLVTVDYPHRALVLRPRSASASFEARAAAAHATIEPCYLVGDHFVVASAQVNDAPPGLFLFDSGLAGGGLMPSPQLISAAGIALDRAHSRTGVGGGGEVTAVPFVARRVAVGSAAQGDVAGIYTPQGVPFGLFPFALWGAISNDFLRYYAYTVDFDAMKIVLEPTAPQPVASPQSAQQIFDTAFRRWQSYPVPPYAVFTDTWHIHATPMGFYTGETNSVEVHRYAVRLADGLENESDPIPSGKLPPALIVPEFLGPFAWTTRSSVHVAPAGTTQSMMAPDVAGLKTIATVVAYEQAPYTIGPANAPPPVENVDGHQAYHLQLHPRSDPQKHNLRDLWIDVQTYDLWKAHFIGTYQPAPGAPVSPTDVTVHFRNVLGCWVVTHAIWTYDDAPMRFLFDVTDDEIGLPPTLPDWLFNDAEYRRHETAGDPDYLGLLLERLRKGGG